MIVLAAGKVANIGSYDELMKCVSVCEFIYLYCAFFKLSFFFFFNLFFTGKKVTLRAS